jgi:hypothetical protein
MILIIITSIPRYFQHESSLITQQTNHKRSNTPSELGAKRLLINM